jgi:hypothetical protein
MPFLTADQGPLEGGQLPRAQNRTRAGIGLGFSGFGCRLLSLSPTQAAERGQAEQRQQQRRGFGDCGGEAESNAAQI